MTYRKSSILLAGILISLAVIGATLAGVQFGGMVRAVLAFPFVFFLPGFALVTAIAPKYDFRLPELFVLSIGLSIMTSIFGTFLINLLPAGLTNYNLAIVLGGLTLLICLISLLHLEMKQADQDVYFNVALSRRQTILLGISGGIVVMAGIIAVTGAKQASSAAFTQLWMLPKAEQANIVTVGIRNMESGQMNFKLVLRGDQGTYSTWDSLVVDPGKTLEVQYKLPDDLAPQKIEAWLYKSDQMDTEPYRKVSYWYPSLSVPAGTANPTTP